jgi:HK97 family phage major capsid protein
MTKDLIEERVKLFEQNKAILDKAAAEKRTLTAEEQQEYDRKDARITEIRGTLDRVAKQEAEERSLGESRGRQTETKIVKPGEITEEQRGLALRAWALGGAANIDDAAMREEAERVCSALRFNPVRREIQSRALSKGTTDAGGYSVPDEMMRAYWEVQKWYGRVRNLATVLTTGTGADLPIPTVNDTTNTGEIIAEAGPVTTTADPVFGQVVLGAHKYSSKAVIVSVELLQDSSINLPQYLGAALGTRIGRIQNTHFTTGTGTGQPKGVVDASSLGKTAAATNAITFDEIIDLTHAVDIAYRNRPSTRFMMNDTIAAYVRKLKDSQNRYLWELSTQAGIADRLNGYPVEINNDVTGTQTTGAKIMLFGAFDAYHVRDAGGPVFARADELRILNHQVVFLAFQRTDANLVDTSSIKHLKNA